ncbi:ATP-binding protein [Streptomyces sp. NPDC019443]|uniref:ATP-binding protein n=1 Tax=Streptomyces sp. NPDC019443 TaxID=3365061 RepID=UPI0037B51FB8
MNQEVTQSTTSVRHFTVLLSSTRGGACLARRLTVQQLSDWGRPFDAAEQIVAELAANAALHGRVSGRDFRLALTLSDSETVRIEVTDTRADRLPRTPEPSEPEAESGRGLLLVEVLADRWGTVLGPAPPLSVSWRLTATSPVRASGCRRAG